MKVIILLKSNSQTDDIFPSLMVNPEHFPPRWIENKEITSTLLLSITVDVLTTAVEWENKLKGHGD